MIGLVVIAFQLTTVTVTSGAVTVTVIGAGQVLGAPDTAPPLAPLSPWPDGGAGEPPAGKPVFPLSPGPFDDGDSPAGEPLMPLSPWPLPLEGEDSGADGDSPAALVGPTA